MPARSCSSTGPWLRSARILPRSRGTASLAGALLVVGAATLSGCSFNSPVQTQIPYQPADGVNLNLGPLSISDLLVVSSGPDAPGQVVGMILNKGAAAQPLTISTAGGSPSKVSIPPGSPRQLDAAPGAVVLTKTGAAPGALVAMTLSTPRTGPTTVSVPVLAPTLFYLTITPAVPAVPGTTPSTPGPLPSTANTGGKVVPEDPFEHR